MKNGSNINIVNTENTNFDIDVTFVSFDVFRYIEPTGQINVISQYNQIDQIFQVNQHVNIEGPENDDDDGLPDAIPLEIIDNMMIPVNEIPIQIDPILYDDNIDEGDNIVENEKLYKGISSKFIKQYEKQTAIKKYIENEQCIISWNNIQYNDYYYECDQCHAKFSIYNFKKWFNTTSDTSCPHCRKNMQCYPQMYYNKRQYDYCMRNDYYGLFITYPVKSLFNKITNWLKKN